LDLRVTEIEDLRLALQEQAAQLQDAESEKNRLANERIAVARTISALESDLKRVRRDAEMIGQNVSQLKAERAKMVARSQEDKIISDRSQAQIRELHVQLVALQTRARKAEEDATNHVCDTYVPGFAGTRDGLFMASELQGQGRSGPVTIVTQQRVQRPHAANTISQVQVHSRVSL
jgi:chromosome segregation ATPase